MHFLLNKVTFRCHLSMPEDNLSKFDPAIFLIFVNDFPVCHGHHPLRKAGHEDGSGFDFLEL